MTLLSAKEGLQKMQELDHADIAAVLSIGTMTALMLAREPNKSRSTLPILMIAILKHKRLMMLSTMMIVRKSFKRMRTLHQLMKTLMRISRVFISPSRARPSQPFMSAQTCLYRGDCQDWGDPQIHLNLLWDLVQITVWLIQFLGLVVNNVLFGNNLCELM